MHQRITHATNWKTTAAEDIAVRILCQNMTKRFLQDKLVENADFELKVQ